MSDFNFSHKLLRKFILFLLSCRFAESIHESRNRTALAIKQGVADGKHSINTFSSSFIDLIKNGTIFVDKSLLVEEFLNLEHNSALLLSPGKWGKTINLRMLKAFFEIQADEKGNEILPKESTSNFKIFACGEIEQDDGRIEKLENPLLISANKTVMDNYHGRYPVININFREVIGGNLFIINNKLRLEIANVFRQHIYMLSVLYGNGVGSEEELREFQGYLEPKNLKNLTSSIWFLSGVLHRHFKRKVIVLIDDYDMPINGFLQSHHFPEQDVEKLLDVIDKFLTQTLQLNEHLFKAMAIGTFKLSTTFVNGWRDYRLYRIAEESEPISQYFGFAQTDAQLLLQKFKIPDKLARQARRWYNGYECQFSREPFYNPVSFSYFLNYKLIGSSWKPSNHHKELLKRIIGRSFSSSIRNTILLLISKQTHRIQDAIYEMSPKEVLMLRELISVQTRSLWQTKIVFSYLLREGYLRLVQGTRNARLPNNHMAALLAGWLVTAYKRVFSIPEDGLYSAASHLYELITNNNLTTHDVERSMGSLFRENRHLLKKTVSTTEQLDLEGGRERAVAAILNCIVLRMQISTRFEYDIYYNGIKKADIVIYDDINRYGVVIDVTSKKRRNARELAKKYENLPNEFADIQTIKFICVSMLTDKRFLITSALLDRSSLKQLHSDSLRSE